MQEKRKSSLLPHWPRSVSSANPVSCDKNYQWKFLMDQRVIENTTDQKQMMPIHCLELRPTLTYVNLTYVEYYLMCLEVRFIRKVIPIKCLDVRHKTLMKCGEWVACQFCTLWTLIEGHSIKNQFIELCPLTFEMSEKNDVITDSRLTRSSSSMGCGVMISGSPLTCPDPDPEPAASNSMKLSAISSSSSSSSGLFKNVTFRG